MKLLFVRHGQTDYNLNRISQGQEVDSDLNTTGITQVKATAELLPNDIDIIVCSPMKRARQTAEILNQKLHIEIIIIDELKEFKYGTLSNKTWDVIAQELGDPEAYQHDLDMKFDYTAFGGESVAGVVERVQGVVEHIRQQYGHLSKVLVSTHSGIIDAMHIIRGDFKSGSENASIHEFEI